MFKPLLACCLALSMLVVNARALAQVVVIPKPQRIETGQGSFQLDAHTGVDAPAGARAQEIVAFLRDAVREQTGVALSRSPHAHGIVLAIDPTVKGDEGYRLSVTPRGVIIQASSDKGLFWGVQTLRQLLPLQHASSIAIPAVRIEDAPAFAYRGFMLDVGRHFYPVSFIKKQLDLLSYYKLDVFHWHLTDDQGWRIQINRYPRLTEVGAWRTEADGRRYGGYYTQGEIRDVVEYARLRNITVIPEIEMPGHSVAALASYPELSCTHQPLTVPTTWGVFKDIDCVGRPGTFVFLQHVLDEVIGLFPSPYVHIGGDEAPKDRWKSCDACQALMREHGLKDEEGLQSYFIQRMQAYLAGKGRTLVGWDEILEGGADRNAIIEAWRGDDEARKALANGNRIVVAGPFYLDAPLDRLTVERVYRTDIAAHAWPDAQDDAAFVGHRAQILGGEAPLWSERANPYNAESKMYPRLLAFAENLWTGKHDADAYRDFAQRLQVHYRWLDAQEVAYGPEDAPVARYAVTRDAAHGVWRVQVRRGFDDLRSHYTLDGKDPTARSPSFTDGVAISHAGLLKVTPFRNGLRYDNPVGFSLVDNLASGHPVTFVHPAAADYASAEVLTDGVMGGSDFHDGRWAAWHDDDLDATIDLQQQTAFHTIEVGFLSEPDSRIVLPERVSYAASSDGRHWTPLHVQALDADVSSPPHRQVVRLHSGKTLKARYIRVTATRRNPAPSGDAAADNWLFADEILVQ